MLQGKKPNTFPLESGKGRDVPTPTTSVQHYTEGCTPCNKKRKINKRHWNWKRVSKNIFIYRLHGCPHTKSLIKFSQKKYFKGMCLAKLQDTRRKYKG